MKNRNVEAAKSYLDGLNRKDLSNAPLAPDVTFEGPLSPHKLIGPKPVIEFLSGVFPIIKDVRIKQHIADGGSHLCRSIWSKEITGNSNGAVGCRTKSSN
jgi:hypothetical protein